MRKPHLDFSVGFDNGTLIKKGKGKNLRYHENK